MEKQKLSAKIQPADQEQQIQFRLQQQEKTTNLNSVSSYLQDYNKFFKRVEELNIKSYLGELHKNKITYNQQRFCAQPNIIYLSKSKFHKAICLSVSFSYFNFEINLLNLTHESFSNCQLQHIGQGSYGKIHRYTNSNKESIVIKTIKYRTNRQTMVKSLEEQQKNLKLAIVQCCFNKLFSVLQVGPKFLNCLGFDIIVYDKTVQFAIQQCSKIKFNSQALVLMLNQLSVSLRMMHSLKIIHGDIKPENIMWSSAFKKYVFIDFGISKVLKQSIGQNSYTQFFGTYQYCLEQMKKSFVQRAYNKVDLYYNDVYALTTTTSKKERLNLYQIISKTDAAYKNTPSTKRYQNFIQNCVLKFYIFQNSYQKFEKLVNEKGLNSITDDVLQFITQLPLSLSSKKIFYLLRSRFFGLNSELVADVEKYVLGQQYQLKQTEQNLSNQLKNRITQLALNSQVPTNELSYFIQIFFDQDVSSKSMIAKQKLKKKLFSMQLSKLKNQQIAQAFWQDFLSYVSNLYTNSDQILQIFNLVKPFLNVKKWRYLNQPIQIPSRLIQKCLKSENFSIFLIAIQIQQKARQIYKVNLFQMNRKRKKENSFFGDFWERDSIQFFNKVKKRIQQIIYDHNPQENRKKKILKLFLKYLEFKANQSDFGYHTFKAVQDFKKQMLDINQSAIADLIISFMTNVINPHLSVHNQISDVNPDSLYHKLFKYNLICKSWPIKNMTLQILCNGSKKKAYLQQIWLQCSNYCFQSFDLQTIFAVEIVIQPIMNSLQLNFEQLRHSLTYIESLIRQTEDEKDYYMFEWILVKIVQILHTRQYKDFSQLGKIYNPTEVKQESIKFKVSIISKIFSLIQQAQIERKIAPSIQIVVLAIAKYYNNYKVCKMYCEDFQILSAEVNNFYNKILKQSQTAKNSRHSLIFTQRLLLQLNEQIISSQEFVTKLQEYSKLDYIYFFQLIEPYTKNFNLFCKFSSNPTSIFDMMMSKYSNQLVSSSQQIINSRLLTFYELHKYFIDQIAVDQKYKQKCQTMMSFTVNISRHFATKQMNYFKNIFQYYGFIQPIVFHFLKGNYGFKNALSFLYNKLLLIYQEMAISKKQKKQTKIDFCNSLPIVEAILVVLLRQTPQDQEYRNDLTAKIKFFIKYVLLCIPNCRIFYKRRLQIKYHHILTFFVGKGFPIVQFFSAKYKNGNYQHHIHMYNRLLMKKYRSCQYPLRQQQMEVFNKQLKIKIQKLRKPKTARQSANLKGCLGIENRISKSNLNKLQKYRQFNNQFSNNRELFLAYLKIINQDSIQLLI